MDLLTNNVPDAENRNDGTLVTEPNEHKLKQLRYFATLGIRPTALAEQFSLTDDYIRRVCEHEIADARNDANLRVLKTIHEMATAGKNLAACILWLKNHAPHLLPNLGTKDDSQKSTKKKPYVWNPNDPNDRVIFRVYNNDGEPNHDY